MIIRSIRVIRVPFLPVPTFQSMGIFPHQPQLILHFQYFPPLSGIVDQPSFAAKVCIKTFHDEKV
jgi:hypothetical protein